VRTLVTYSEEETRRFGYELGQELPLQSVVCFFGDLGAGKTTLIKGLVAGATECLLDEVHSPTYVYLHIHQGLKTVYHFDLYRLRDTDEFLSMGFDEYFYADGICCIEWSERIDSLIFPGCLTIQMEHLEENCRKITLRKR
jgi:tRNA threonylcarbamoyladenosine biosynthesis protein TsaE